MFTANSYRRASVAGGVAHGSGLSRGLSGASLAVIALIVCAPPALAQTAAPMGVSPGVTGAAAAPAPSAGSASTAAPAATTGIQDIVVTAQKRSESINKVPLTIVAATGDQLAKVGVTDTRDLAKITPGFTFADTQLGNPVYTLRGVGFYDQSLSSTPAVSVYNDEVPLTYPAETRGAVLDLERVEILKGPQGTLFGQNATGGAINYIAAKPTDTPKFGLDLGFSRFNQLDVGGFASGPITDTLKVRASFKTTQSNEGWQKSYTHDDTLGTMNKTLWRLLTDWTPTDRLSVSLNINGWVDKSETQAAQLQALLPQVPSALPPGLATYPTAPHSDRAADWEDFHGHPARDEKFLQASLRLNYNIGDSTTLTSITSYDRLRGDSFFDADGLAEPAYDYENVPRIRTEYQELRLSGKSGRLNWIMGGNYEHDVTNQVSTFLASYSSLEHPTPDIAITQAGTLSHTKAATYGIFGNAEYKILDNLTIQGGVRFNHDKHSGYSCGFVGPDSNFGPFFTILSNELSGGLSNPTVNPGDCYTLGPAPTFLPGLVQQRLVEHNVSWRGALTWNVTSGTLLYTTVSKGYKNGGLPALSATVSASLAPYKQESVQSYEAGFKSTLAGRKLQLNGAFFYYDYRNKQILGNYLDSVFGIQPIIVNIPKSRLWGIEGQIIAQPISGLSFSGAATYLNSRIQKYTGYDTLGDFGDQSGTKIPFAPSFTAAADAEYDWNVGGIKAFVGGGLTYNSRSNAGVGDLSQLTIDPYTLLDVRGGVRAPDGKWSVTLFGNNVTNKYYWTTVLHVQDALIRYSGRPATYGLRVSFRL